MNNNSIIRIIIYSFVLLSVTLFEEPRISILMRLVFPNEFSKAFSYSIPFLVVCITIMSSRPGNGIWKHSGSVSASVFGVILVLSYLNTVLISIDQNTQAREEKITELRSLISSKQSQYQKPAVRNCYPPAAGIDGYEDLLAGYRSCVYTARQETERAGRQENLLSAEITVLTADLEKLQKSGIDWVKPLTQAATGISLSIILSIASAVFCVSLARELNNFLLISEASEEAKLAVWISEGLSVRQIADLLEVSKSTADRKIRELKLSQQWDTSGTVMGQSGTAERQGKKQPKSGADPENRAIPEIQIGFGGFAGSGRMS